MTRFVLCEIKQGTMNYLRPNGKYLVYIRTGKDKMDSKQILEFLNKNYVGNRAQILLYDKYHIKNLNHLEFGEKVLFEPTFATTYFKVYLQNYDVGYAYDSKQKKWIGILPSGALLDNEA